MLPAAARGLLAIEALLIGLTTPATVLHKVEGNLEVLLLLIFMVAGIFFLKDLLLYMFTRLLLGCAPRCCSACCSPSPRRCCPPSWTRSPSPRW